MNSANFDRVTINKELIFAAVRPPLSALMFVYPKPLLATGARVELSQNLHQRPLLPSHLLSHAQGTKKGHWRGANFALYGLISLIALVDSELR